MTNGKGVKTGQKQTQTQEQSNEVKKVNSLEELIKTNNSKMTYAVIRDRNNVIITLSNKAGLIRINIVTALTQNFVSGFRADVIQKVITALQDLNAELEKYGYGKTQNGNVKVY
jgi:phosphopantetheine adenylyltransferase